MGRCVGAYIPSNLNEVQHPVSLTDMLICEVTLLATVVLCRVLPFGHTTCYRHGINRWAHLYDLSYFLAVLTKRHIQMPATAIRATPTARLN